MKQPNMQLKFLAGVALAMAGGRLLAGAIDFAVRPPTLDAEGRFWVYRNGPAQPIMPFSPYGWMSDSSNLTELISIDLNSADHPNTLMRSSGVYSRTAPLEKEACIRVKVTWQDATWASIAFIAGPDKPPWWGETPGGRYYNLTALTKKRLVFYARGERGGEVIKAQIGVLGGKPYGDSLPKPIIGDEIKLSQDWSRHEIDFKDFPNADMSRICNGFGVIVERVSQPGSPSDTQFFIDDVYFE